LDYASFDNGEVGYKVYIGPQQYFVITDIGNGRYQWYAFLAKPVGTAVSDILLKVRSALDPPSIRPQSALSPPSVRPQSALSS